MEKSIRLLLVVLPWVYWPLSHSPYEIPKTWIILVASSLSLIFLSKRGEKPRKQRRDIGWVLGVLWGWLLVSSLFAGHFWQSFWGNYYRADGLLTLSAMIVLGLAWRATRDDLRALGWVSVLTSIATIVTGGDSALLFGNQVFLGGYLAVSLPLAWLVGRTAFLLQLIAIALLGVWGASLAAVIMILVLVLRKRPRLLVGAMLVVTVVVVGVYQQEQRLRGITPETVAESRGRIWTKAALALKERPLMGWGWAQYGEAFRAISWPMHYDQDVHVDRSHAGITEYAVAGGVIAMGLYLWLVGATLGTLWRSESEVRRSLGYVCLLYIVYSQTNITTVAVDWLFFASVGEAIREKREQG